MEYGPDCPTVRLFVEGNVKAEYVIKRGALRITEYGFRVDRAQWPGLFSFNCMRVQGGCVCRE